MKKRFLSMMLTVMMVLSLVPAVGAADVISGTLNISITAPETGAIIDNVVIEDKDGSGRFTGQVVNWEWSRDNTSFHEKVSTDTVFGQNLFYLLTFTLNASDGYTFNNIEKIVVNNNLEAIFLPLTGEETSIETVVVFKKTSKIDAGVEFAYQPVYNGKEYIPVEVESDEDAYQYDVAYWRNGIHEDSLNKAPTWYKGDDATESNALGVGVNPIDAGQYYLGLNIKLNGQAIDAGGSFSIYAKSIKNAKVDLDDDKIKDENRYNYTYVDGVKFDNEVPYFEFDGTEKEFGITGIVDAEIEADNSSNERKNLKEGDAGDYTIQSPVADLTKINAGDYFLNIQGKNNYKETYSIPWRIVKATPAAEHFDGMNVSTSLPYDPNGCSIDAPTLKEAFAGYSEDPNNPIQSIGTITLTYEKDGEIYGEGTENGLPTEVGTYDVIVNVDNNGVNFTEGTVPNGTLVITKANSGAVLEKAYVLEYGTTYPTNEFTVKGLLADRDVPEATFNSLVKDDADDDGVDDGEWTWTITADDDILEIISSSTDEDNATVKIKDIGNDAVITGAYVSGKKLASATITIDVTPKILKYEEEPTPGYEPDRDFGFTNQEKVYNGLVSDAATYVTLDIIDKVPTDDVTVDTFSAIYDVKDVGNTRIITISNITLTGDDSDKYQVEDNLTIEIPNAVITPRPVNVSIEAKSVYGGDNTSVVVDEAKANEGITVTTGLTEGSPIYGSDEYGTSDNFDTLELVWKTIYTDDELIVKDAGYYQNVLEKVSGNSNYDITFDGNLTIAKADFNSTDDTELYQVTFSDTSTKYVYLNDYDLPTDATFVFPADYITEHNRTETETQADVTVLNASSVVLANDTDIFGQYNITDGLDKKSVGDTATITFTVSSTNYNDFDITADVELVEKKVLSIDVKPDEYIYDGDPKPGYVEGSVEVEPDVGIPVEYWYRPVGEEDFVDDEPKDAGTYELLVKIPDDDPLYTGKTSVEFTIKQIPVTVKPDDIELVAGKTTVPADGDITYKFFNEDGNEMDLFTITKPSPVDFIIKDAEGNALTPGENFTSGDYTIQWPDDTNRFDIAVYNPDDTTDVSTNYRFTYLPGGMSTSVKVEFETNGGDPIHPVTLPEDNIFDPDDYEPTKPDHEFEGWYLDEDLTDPIDEPTKFDTSTKVYAKWEEIEEPKDDRFYWSLLHLFSQQFKITADCNEGGIVSPEGVTSVYFDESVDYTITPYEGYEIVSVLIDDVDIGAVEEYTFKRVQEDHTITAVFQEIGWENPFTDVSESAWYYDAVEYVNENGLMLGTNDAGNLFAPDQNLNRATVVTALWRLEGSPIVHAGEDFLDVEPDMWYTQAVRWATSESIVLGFDDNTFRPLDDVTHEQVCAFLHRYAKYKGIDDGMMLGILPQYEYSAWAENDVIWAETYGILNAVPDIFDLTESATRAHFAAYMFQFAGLDEE